MTDKAPKIDPEIRDLLPKLTDEEFGKLSIKFQMEGCLKPLIVWEETGVLLDGHHSLAICEEHKIPYQLAYMKFPTRELAIEWVIDNQLGRRNLTDERRSYYRGKKYLNHKNPVGNPQLAQNELIGQTAENIGKSDGVSGATVKRDAAFAHAVDALEPDAKQQVLNGQASAPKSDIAASRSEFCDRCRRKGPIRDCLQCAERRRIKIRKKPKKIGAEKLNWREAETRFGQIARWPDDIAAAFPEESRSKEFNQARKLLKVLGELWQRWKKRIIGDKGR